VISNIFDVHPNYGEDESILTNICFRWVGSTNHQRIVISNDPWELDDEPSIASWELGTDIHPLRNANSTLLGLAFDASPLAST